MRRRSVLSALGLAVALVACGQGQGPGGKRGKGAPTEAVEETRATPVKAVPLQTGPIEDRVTSASTIEAERQVTVHAEATGRVLDIEFEEGDEVESGATLARVRRDMQASGYDRAKANLEKAKRDVERVRALHARGAASQEELANIELTLRSAQIDVKDRRRDLSNTTVVAPFDGTVTDRFVNAGAFVTSGQQLYGITDFSSLVARVYVPERELDRIRVGQSADVIGKAAAGRRTSGTVARIAPRVDAATGTVKVTVSLPAPEQGDTPSSARGFLPGMYAEVVLTTERRENALLVPKAALVREEERVFVFVVDASGEKTVAKRKMIELGLANDDFVEATSGIEPSEQVIVAGQIGLKDGAEIELVEDVTMPDGGGSEGAGDELAAAEGAGDGQAEGT
jgi:membrane fusion protein (multidrug efflux system)